MIKRPSLSVCLALALAAVLALSGSQSPDPPATRATGNPAAPTAPARPAEPPPPAPNGVAVQPTPTRNDPPPTVSERTAPIEGALAPDFRLDSLEGAPLALSEFRGQAVLLNFWTTWCPFCRRERAVLQEAYDTYADQGFVILAVDIGEEAELVKAYADELKLSFPMLLDQAGAVSRGYNVRGIPASFFITRQGIIHQIHVGPLDKEIIEKSLAGIL